MKAKLKISRWFILAGLLVVMAARHPYHVNVLEFRYNPANPNWQITVRVFTHEWESVFKKNGEEGVDLKNPADSVRNNGLLKNYVLNHVTAVTGVDTMKFQWIGFENIQDETRCYVESNAGFNGKLAVTTDILYEHGHEQQTIVHLYVGEKRISRKITAPLKTVTLKTE